MSAAYPDYSPGVLRAFSIIATFFHSLAIASTACRVINKVVTGRFWWDDTYISFAGLLDALLIACIWVRKWSNDHLAATGHIHTNVRVAISWTESMAHTCLLWFARISILASTVRLLPEGMLRRITVAACWSLVVVWLSITGHKAYMCKRDDSWHYEWRVDCRMGPSYTVIKISTDVASCMLLIGLPLRMLWNSALPKFECWMIRVVFASNILSTSISALHDAYLLSPNHVLEGYTGHIEAASTLAVSNLLVITTGIYRCIRRYRRNAYAGSSSDTSESQSTTSPTASPDTSPVEMTETQRRRQHSSYNSFTQLGTRDLYSSENSSIPRFVGSHLGSTFEQCERTGRNFGFDIAPISRPKPVLTRDDPDIFLRHIRPPIKPSSDARLSEYTHYLSHLS